MKFSRKVMRQRPGVLALFVGVLVGCSDSGQEPQSVDRQTAFALSGVTVIDGRGSDAMTGYTVVVRNGRIDAVEPDGTIELEAIEQIQSDGKFLIPGLWDLHAHTFADSAVFGLYLEAGVTTIRDMGCPADCTRQLQRERRLREFDPARSPRMIIGGPMIDGDSPYDDYASHYQVSLETIPAAIQKLQSLQVDFVKVRDFLSVDEFYAIADAANKAGLRIAGHVPTAISAPEAVRAGMLTVEHEGSLFGGMLLAASADEEQLRKEMLAYMQEAVATGNVEELYAKALGADFLRRVVDSYDSEKATELVQAFVDSGSAIVPTLVVQDPQLRSSNPVFNGRDRASDATMQMVPDKLLASWRETAETYVLDQPFSASDHAAMAAVYELLVALIENMHESGVPILAGTDAAFPNGTPWIWPGHSLHDELELLVKAGLTPAEAIAAASGTAASHLGISDVGTIEAGKVADLVLLTADPLSDVRNTTSISEVIIGGVFVDREAISERRLKLLAEFQ